MRTLNDLTDEEKAFLVEAALTGKVRGPVYHYAAGVRKAFSVWFVWDGRLRIERICYTIDEVRAALQGEDRPLLSYDNTFSPL